MWIKHTRDIELPDVDHSPSCAETQSMIHIMSLASMSGLCKSVSVCVCVCISNRKHSNSACIDVQPVDLFDDRLPINTAAPKRKGEVVQHGSVSLCH